MRLDKRRTVLVGFAFLSICAFWQMYNNVVPLILTNTFHMNETWSGAIMAADNVAGLFLLPLFGGLSDRCRSPMGRRKPFLICGTAAAVVLMLVLPGLDNSYAAAPTVWKTAAFVAVLGGLLVAMGSYRSPAVALMPDVTPKPLRSEANAVINLMGAMGGVLYLLLAAVLYSKEQPGHTDYYPLFAAVAAIMILSAVVVSLTVREPSREEVLRRDAEEAAREEPKEPPKPARRAARKKGAEAAPAPAPEAEPPSRVPKEIITLLADSVEMLADEDGYAPLGEVANLLVRKKRDFDPRNFGFSKLSKMIKSLDRFEVDVRQVGDNNTDIYVRDKQGKDK